MQVAIAIGVGLLSVVAGVFELVRAHRLKAVAVSTTGVLVAFHGVHHRYPVFRFSVPDGREVEVRSDVGWTHSRRRVGDPVDVLYDPAEPTHARIGGLGVQRRVRRCARHRDRPGVHRNGRAAVNLPLRTA